MILATTVPLETSVSDFIFLFASIFYEALPFVVVGAVIAGFMEELVPQQMLARIIPRNALLAAALSGLLGLVFPMCECGIVPVMRRLLRKGLPLSCCVAYLLAGPIINVVVLLNTFVAFGRYPLEEMGGFWMVSLRAGLGYLVAVTTALIVERQYRKYGQQLLVPLPGQPRKPPFPAEKQKQFHDENESVTAGTLEEVVEETKETPNGQRSLWQRISNISEAAVHDFVDIAVFLILGALLAAYVRQLLISYGNVEQTIQSHPALAIGSMMTLSVLLCLCSEADAFVAVNIAAVPPAAKLAFLVLGPMLDLKLYMMYTRVFRPRLIWTIIPTVVVQVFVYSLITYLIWVKWMQP